MDPLGAERGGVLGVGWGVDDVDGEARVSGEDNVDGFGAVVAVVVLGGGRGVELEDVVDVAELGLDDALGEHGEEFGFVLDDPACIGQNGYK